jgi:hypothetical protein
MWISCVKAHWNHARATMGLNHSQVKMFLLPYAPAMLLFYTVQIINDQSSYVMLALFPPHKSVQPPCLYFQF